MKKFLTAATLCLGALSTMAELKMSRIFGDEMILQQNQKNAIWGWTDANSKVSVKASWGEKGTAVADKDGYWKVMLKTPSYGTNKSITVTDGKETKQFKDVAIGEVWLCFGQSNMGWSMGSSFEAEKEADVNLPNYRIFQSAREHAQEPAKIRKDRLSKWKKCTPEVAASTSAVSYYFGKKLHTTLNIPVGIIVQAYAGTPIEAWMPKSAQLADKRLQLFIADSNKSNDIQVKKGATPEKMLAKYNKELAAYNKAIDSGKTKKNKTRALTPPVITKPKNMAREYLGHCYNGMISPIQPYGIKGCVWYQGERNAKYVDQCENYRNQLPMLIKYYRESWNKMTDGSNNPKMPFYFTQLPSWNPEQTEPVEGVKAVWSVSREMMRLVSNEVENCGMSVSIDTGSPVQLHPQIKKPIGIRHAYLALANTYGKDIVGSGPKYKSVDFKGNKAVLSFDSIGSGLMFFEKKAGTTFAVAGADKVWHFADAKIVGDTVVVSSSKVSKPVAVRYAWAMNPSQRTLLYNKEGIPASPFRTDNWPLYTPGEKLPKVFKPNKPKNYEGIDWARPEMTQ